MPATPTAGRVLLAYFSRAGENYYYGGRRDLDVGNTERLAQMIADLTEVDVHRIDAADPYPDDYDATVARNVTEQNDNARPGIANPLDSIEAYSTVLLASPIWNVRAPMIMSTFTDAYDFTGKTVLPVVTYAVSGLGSVRTRLRHRLSRRPDRRGSRCPRRRSHPATQPGRHLAPGRRAHHPLTPPTIHRTRAPRQALPRRSQHGQAHPQHPGGLRDRARLHGPQRQLRRPARHRHRRRP